MGLPVVHSSTARVLKRDLSVAVHTVLVLVLLAKVLHRDYLHLAVGAEVGLVLAVFVLVPLRHFDLLPSSLLIVVAVAIVAGYVHVCAMIRLTAEGLASSHAIISRSVNKTWLFISNMTPN